MTSTIELEQTRVDQDDPSPIDNNFLAGITRDRADRSLPSSVLQRCPSIVWHMPDGTAN